MKSKITLAIVSIYMLFLSLPIIDLAESTDFTESEEISDEAESVPSMNPGSAGNDDISEAEKSNISSNVSETSAPSSVNSATEKPSSEVADPSNLSTESSSSTNTSSEEAPTEQPLTEGFPSEILPLGSSPKDLKEAADGPAINWQDLQEMILTAPRDGSETVIELAPDFDSTFTTDKQESADAPVESAEIPEDEKQGSSENSSEPSASSEPEGNAPGVAEVSPDANEFSSQESVDSDVIVEESNGQISTVDDSETMAIGEVSEMASEEVIASPSQSSDSEEGASSVAENSSNLIDTVIDQPREGLVQPNALQGIKAETVDDLQELGTRAVTIKNGQSIHLTGSGLLIGEASSPYILNVQEQGTLILDGPAFTYTRFVNNGNLNLQSGAIEDTRGADGKGFGAPVIFTSGSNAIFTMTGGLVADNNVDTGKSFPESFYSVITIRDNAQMILSGGTIKNNRGENTGPIFLFNANLEMSAGEIIENSTGYHGGGICAIGSSKQQHSITMTGGSISKNKGIEYKGDGGAVYLANVDMTISGDSAISGNVISRNGGGIYAENCNLVISGGTFSENIASKSGGALSIYGKSQTTISKGLFSQNKCGGFWGGGAIYNDFSSTLTMYNTLIVGNHIEKTYIVLAGKRRPSNQGGGVWNCKTGKTVTHITNGVAIYDNSAPDQGEYSGAGDDFVNVRGRDFEGSLTGNDPTIVLAERMLGGGVRCWYQDGSIYGEATNLDDPTQNQKRYAQDPAAATQIRNGIEINDQAAFKSVPASSAKDLANYFATVRIIENSTLGTDGITRVGAGIANNGTLIFGREGTYKLKIEKKWSGISEEEIPEEITIGLYVGDFFIEDIHLTTENGWTAEVENFPDPKSLEPLKINFREEGDQYDLSFSEPVINNDEYSYSFVLTNSKPTEPSTPPSETTTTTTRETEPLTTDIRVIKSWNDNDNQEGMRPGSVTFKLLADGEDTGKRLTISASDRWTGYFTGLPTYDGNHRIVYTIEEVNAPEGYQSQIQGSSWTGFKVTNIRTNKTVDVEGQKTWNDNDNEAGKRPQSITIRLLKNGVEINSRTVSEADGWSWSFRDLPQFEDGKLIEYRIVEDTVDGYSSELSGYDVINHFGTEPTTTPTTESEETTTTIPPTSTTEEEPTETTKATEPTTTPTVPTAPEVTTPPTPPTTNPNPGVPSTGETMDYAYYPVILLAAAAVLLVLRKRVKH